VATKISVAGWADRDTVRAARQLAKRRGIKLAEYVAIALEAAVAHDRAKPEDLDNALRGGARRAVAAANLGGDHR